MFRQQGGPRVAVYGANGHTGRFVVRAFFARGFEVLALGRDKDRLASAGLPTGVAVEAVSLDDPPALDRCLSGVAAVVNCAGPFLDTADPLVDAAMRTGVHYLDVTAEQESARRLYDRAAQIEAAGIVAMPAMSFWGGLADLLATAAMADWAEADEIRIGSALDSWKPTEGTRITSQRNTFPRLVISDGQLQPLANPPPRTDWSFAGDFGRQEMVELPFTEAILIARHLNVREVHHFMNTAPLGDLRDPKTPPPQPEDASGRSSQRFRVEVEVRRGEALRRGAVEGRDIYGVTAPLIVEAAARLTKGPFPAGVHAPGSLFDARSFLAAVEPDMV
ncbi:saccharopine dehydrogenase family protein [Brevundimonas sp.]|uniref:saccharopine dehydrogenase family protein n=1 Tax=Brevundimonas sp. TaxID=1871086 RepID=UPI003918AAA0